MKGFMKNFMSAVFKVPLTVFLGVALSSCGVMALAQSKPATATAKPVLVTYGSTGPLTQDSTSGPAVWVDTHAKTFVVGVVWLYQDNTCRLYPGQQGISAIRAPLHGKVFFTQENLTNPPGSWCAGHTYLYWVARYTWTDADETTLEDPVTLQSTDVYQGYTSTDNYSFAAMFAHIVADPVAASGSNAQGTQQDVANSNLIDPPQGAARYTWTMTGGAGILAFSNGAPSMTTTTSTAPVVSLNGASDTINVSVTVSYPAGSNSLSYGPTPYTYTPPLKIKSPQQDSSYPLSDSNYTENAPIPYQVSGGTGGQTQWSIELSYQTSGGYPQTPAEVTSGFTTSGTGTYTAQYTSVGGQLTVKATQGSQSDSVTAIIPGTAIPTGVLTDELVSLYGSNQPTPRLMTGIASVESTIQQFSSSSLYGQTAMWPLASYDGGSHIGLMQMPTSMDYAFNWQDNASNGVALFNSKVSMAKSVAASIVSSHNGLPALTSLQLENMALVLYGPYAGGNNQGMQYYVPSCVGGTVSGVNCVNGQWQWIANTAGNANGVQYANKVRNSIQ